VTVCGVDLAGARERDRTALRAHRLGRVDQHHAWTLRPELSIVDNVALQSRVAGVPARAARARAGELLDRLGLAHLAGRRPVTLSGGEAQQVAVCAAVAHRPALVLADEPTGELDRASAEAVYDLLAAAAADAGAALVVVTHDTRAARIADRIVRIRDGRLSEEWTPENAESLVVDDRGWVRLPEPLRLRAGVADRVRADAGDGRIVLSGGGPVVTAPAAAAAVPAVAGRTAAEAAGVAVRRDGRTVLDGAALAVRAGLLTVVRGPSGSGKTTLLRVLTGLERPDAGGVRLLDTDLSTLDRDGLAALRRRGVSVAAQRAALVETLDVADNLDLVRRARGLPPDPAAVDGWLDALGLAALRHRPVRVLSGGERQRVAVARVLAVSPAVAVLDEPTSQQDEANAERLVAALVAAARAGAAVVAASHDPVLVSAADAVLTLG